MQIKRMRLADLRPAEYNPRRISDKSFKALGKSISRFGMLMPIVWNQRSGNIVGGHQRYRHLIERGVVEADVVVVDLDEKAEIELNLTLNNRAVRGDFTPEVAGMLRLVEAKLGAEFGEMGMRSLLDRYDKFEGASGEEKEPPDADLPKQGRTEKPEDSSEGVEDSSSGKSQPIITCPKCKSRWTFKGEIVEDRYGGKEQEG